MLWIGLRRSRRRDPLRLLVPAPWLVVGLLFLVGFRIGLNVADSNVIDVGYAGVIGADRLADGDKLWGAFPKDNEHGDTYGPVTYAAYVPFEQVLPWSGRWDDLPAAHAAADRLRPAVPGAAVPHRAAHARPDARARARLRVGGEPVHALRAGLQRQRRPRGRARPRRHRGRVVSRRPRRLHRARGDGEVRAAGAGAALRHLLARALRFVLGGALALVPCLLLVLGYGGLHEFYDRTLAFQASRGSPFSIWGLYGWNTAQAVVQAGAVLLAVAVAFLPRRRDLVGLSALAAAVLIGLQLGVTHWFYLYMVWFLGPLLIALLADAEPPERHGPPTYAEQLAQLPAPAVAWR